METHKNILVTSLDPKFWLFKDVSSPRCNLWEKQMGNRDIIIFLTGLRSVVLTQSEKHKRPVPSSIYTEEKQCMKKCYF